MSSDHQHRRSSGEGAPQQDLADAPRGGCPGKRTLTERFVMRRADGAPRWPGNAEATIDSTRGAGAPLPVELRERLERSLGVDLGAVRVHTSDASAAAASELGARAFATGQDIHFARGEYRPGDEAGQHLIAHEVAHTVQQAGGAGLQAKLEVSEPGDALEVEADRAADAMMRGERATLSSSGGGAARQVWRDAASVQPPNLSHQLVIDVAKGDAWALQFKVNWAFGKRGAVTAKAGDDDAEAQVTAFKPKLATTLNDRSQKLSVALVEAGFELAVWEGLSVGVKVTGPEASVGAKGVDLGVMKVAVTLKGDITHWLDDLPPGVSLSAEIEGSFTVAGKLLAKLAEMAAISQRVGVHADALERAAHDFEDAATTQRDLEIRRDELNAERNTLPRDTPDNLRTPIADAYDEQIKELDRQIDAHRVRADEAVDRMKFHRGELDDATRKLAKVESTLDGRIAKSLGRRISGAVRQRINSAIAKLVPILNLFAFAMDVLAVVELFKDWRDSGYGLPTVGDGGPDPFGDTDQATGGDGTGGGGAVAGGAAQPGGTEATEPKDASGSAPEVIGTGDRGPPSTDGKPDAGTLVSADERGLHPTAQRVLEAIERRGFVLDDDQIAAIGHVVPADLPADDLQELIERLRTSGTKPHDAAEMIGLIAEAVAQVGDEATTIAIDGQAFAEEDDRKPDGGATTAPPPKRKKRKAKDRRFRIDVDAARRWFAADEQGGLATTERFDAWKVDFLTGGEEVVDGVRYIATDANASGHATPHGLWDVSVELAFAEWKGDRTKTETFRWLIDPVGGGSSPVTATDVAPIAKLVKRSPGNEPPTVVQGIADFGDYSLRIQDVIAREPVPDTPGAWRITFRFDIVKVRVGASGGLIDDAGNPVPLREGERFVKTVDVVPAR